MSNVRPLRPDDAAMALPRVNARFVAAVGAITFKDGKAKVSLELPEGTPPEIIYSLARSQRDGNNAVVLVSRNLAQVIPGTENDDDMAMAAKVAVGLELRDELARQLLEQTDRQTGEISSNGPRPEEAPLLPVGTVIGKDLEEAAAAVDGHAEVDRRGTARAAGRALGRARRKV